MNHKHTSLYPSSNEGHTCFASYRKYHYRVQAEFTAAAITMLRKMAQWRILLKWKKTRAIVFVWPLPILTTSAALCRTSESRPNILSISLNFRQRNMNHPKWSRSYGWRFLLSGNHLLRFATTLRRTRKGRKFSDWKKDLNPVQGNTTMFLFALAIFSPTIFGREAERKMPFDVSSFVGWWSLHAHLHTEGVCLQTPW